MYEVKQGGKAPVRRRFVANAPYRVAHDVHGDWWIWQRSEANSWTTLRRCASEAEAQLLCDELIAGKSEAEKAQPKS